MVETQDNRHSRRLFLALWPNSSERRQIADLARPLTVGREVIVENLHLTLVFLGNTDSKRQQCYERVLQDIQAPSFTLTLDAIGYWPKPRILWLGTSQPSNDLADLVKDLHERLSGCGFKPETRPFNAHVTLARRFPGPPPIKAMTQPISWFIQRIALVESCPQAGRVHYRVLRYWPEH
ncbi:MAG: RNA 2',3'-cyclic phosphodiesterase [Candidatus Competibacteraceae bacterium]|jgi:2'-5' RNA ligase|nr:RNA 2',3'-cyclic phosphodiesterase [Candidatus Competibacteraceae bacterium]